MYLAGEVLEVVILIQRTPGVQVRKEVGRQHLINAINLTFIISEDPTKKSLSLARVPLEAYPR